MPYYQIPNATSDSYGLRVATVGMFLYMLVLLPLYWSAACSGMEGELGGHCANMTNYDQTTMANIIIETEIGYGMIGRSARLYVVVFCSWIVTWYACHELKQEWVDILAMRRYYFLERDHWKRQRDNLTRMRTDSLHRPASRNRDIVPQAVSAPPSPAAALLKSAGLSTLTSATIGKATKGLSKLALWKQKKNQEPDYMRNREPWIPHPEQNDTPPAIALYTVLVGGIPSKPYFGAPEPNEIDGSPDIEAGPKANDNSDTEWQLSVTSAFFDHCIPNQPGFSSSVAAVTILPNAKGKFSNQRNLFQVCLMNPLQQC